MNGLQKIESNNNKKKTMKQKKNQNKNKIMKKKNINNSWGTLWVKHDTKATEKKTYKYMNKRENFQKKMWKKLKQKTSCQQYGFINLSLSFKCWD